MDDIFNNAVGAVIGGLIAVAAMRILARKKDVV